MNPIYLVDFTSVKHTYNSGSQMKFHLDLGKIVSISEPFHVDMMGRGGHFICVQIEVQLRDEKIEKMFHVPSPGAVSGDMAYEKAYAASVVKTQSEVSAVVNDLVRAWEAFRQWETSKPALYSLPPAQDGD